MIALQFGIGTKLAREVVPEVFRHSGSSAKVRLSYSRAKSGVDIKPLPCQQVYLILSRISINVPYVLTHTIG